MVSSRRGSRWDDAKLASDLAAKLWRETKMNEWKEKLAVRIQAVFRGFLARGLAAEERRVLAATKIQRFVRCRLVGPKNECHEIVPESETGAAACIPSSPCENDDQLIQTAIIQAERERAELSVKMAPVVAAVSRVLRSHVALCPDKHRMLAVDFAGDRQGEIPECDVCGNDAPPADIVIGCDECDFISCSACVPPGVRRVIAAVKLKHGIKDEG